MMAYAAVLLLGIVVGFCLAELYTVRIRARLTDSHTLALRKVVASQCERLSDIEKRLGSDALPTERLDTLERRFESLNQDTLRHTNKITKALARMTGSPDIAEGVEPENSGATTAPTGPPMTEAERLRALRQRMG